MSEVEGIPPPDWPPPAVPVTGGYLPRSNWSYGHTALALAVGIVLGPFLAILVIALAQGVPTIDDVPTVVVLVAQTASSFAVLFALSWMRGTGSWRDDFGFVLEPRYIWGIAAGMALQVVVALITLPLVELFTDDAGPQQEIAQLARDLTGTELAVFGLLVAVLTPVFEEVVFRGMLLGRLVKRMSRNPALLISAAAFAATHLLDPNALLVVPGLFLVGLVLGYAALRTGSLALPIFMHVGVNGLAVLLLAFADELEELIEPVEAVLSLVLR